MPKPTKPPAKLPTKAEASPAEADAVTLVEVRKDGERLLVHPTTVNAHKAAGWRVAGAVDEP